MPTMDATALAEWSGQSMRDDTVIVHMLYRERWITFDVPYMQAKYLSPAELMEQYFSSGLALIEARPTASGETSTAVTSSSETTV